MAAPVITSVTKNPDAPINPGGTVQVTAVAVDPDSRTLAGTMVATDMAGASAQVAVEITVQDPVTFALTFTDPGVAVVQTSPGVFTVQVPA